MTTRRYTVSRALDRVSTRQRLFICGSVLLLSVSFTTARAQAPGPLVQGLEGVTPVAYLALSREAGRLYEAKEYGGAAEAYERLVGAYPIDPANWWWLGRSRHALEQYREAAHAFREADKLGVPAYARALPAYAALAWAQAGEPDSALTWLEKALVEYRYEAPISLLQIKAFDSLRQDPRFRALAPPQVDSTASRVEGWTTDIDYVLAQIQQLNPKLGGQLPDTLAHAAERLKGRIPTLSDAQIAVEMQRLLGLLQQGHNRIELEPGALPESFDVPGRLPIVMSLRADGVLITDAAEEFRSLLGGRVRAIEGTPIERVLEHLLPLVPTQASLRGNTYLLSLPHVLQTIGTAEHLDRIQVSVIDRAGRQRTVELPAVREPKFTSLAGVPPLAHSRPGEPYWFEHLPEYGTVYVNFSQGIDAKEETLAAFAQRLRRFLAEHGDVESLVVDLRANTGGNTYLYPELLRTLIWFDAQEGHRTYALVGRYLASAAMNFAVDMDRLTNALFVGEPTGATVEVEDAVRLVLPYSGVRFSLASATWNLSSPRDRRRWIAPDVPVAETIEDSLANRDPVLDTVLDLIRSRPAP